MNPSILAALVGVLLVGLVVGAGLGALWARLAEPRDPPSGALDQAAVRHGLDRLAAQVHDLERSAASWQGQLRQQVDDVRTSSEALRRETATLATALRRPQVRGRWGELHLRRAVELAGLVERCDFSEQVTVRDGPAAAAQRPDLVVHLAGGKNVVVDAKVPLEAFLDAAAAEADAAEPDEVAAHLRRHARQLRAHVDELADRGYWRSLPGSPEFVVLFVPGEAFLSAALDADPALLEYAATRAVVLATPTTLIALLLTVAHAWKQEAIADQAREIHRLATGLHRRLLTMTAHLDRLGRSLTGAVGAYNSAVGSLEGRVLVTARQLEELGVGDEPVGTPAEVEVVTRPLRLAGPAARRDLPDEQAL